MTTSIDANKKLWTWQSALVDHVRIMLQVPMMLISPAFLSATEMEAVQSAVSDVNSCNLSARYRREAARITGLDSSERDIWISFGRCFGLKDGTGREVETLRQGIVEESSNIKASTAHSIAFLQLWMDLMGNTILGFLRGTICGKRRLEQSVLFEILFFVYYIIPYIAFVVLALLLKIIPANPPGPAKLTYKIIHIFQVIVAAVFIIPFGLIGVVTLPLYIITGRDASPLPSRNDYTSIPPIDIEDNNAVDVSDPGSVVSEGEFFSVTLVKPTPESKVGIRFGSNRAGQVMITNIRSGSIAAGASAPGLKIGDLMNSINGLSMESKSPKFAAATLLGTEGTVTLVLSRGGGTIIDDEATV